MIDAAEPRRGYEYDERSEAGQQPYFTRKKDGARLVSRRYKLRILAVSPSILHVSYTERRTFSHEDKPELAGVLQGSDLLCIQEEHQIYLRTAVITAKVSLETGSITFYKTNPGLRSQKRGRMKWRNSLPIV